MYETTVTVIGRVASSVDHRNVGIGEGTPRANFRVACTERRRDWRSGDWADGETLYLSVTCWRGLADNLKASLQVGDPVVVRGRMYTRQYETEGRSVSVMEMEASAVGPDLARCTTVVTRVKGGASTRAAEAVAGAVLATEATGLSPASAEGQRARVLVPVGGGAEAADTPPGAHN